MSSRRIFIAHSRLHIQFGETATPQEAMDRPARLRYTHPQSAGKMPHSLSELEISAEPLDQPDPAPHTWSAHATRLDHS